MSIIIANKDFFVIKKQTYSKHCKNTQKSKKTGAVSQPASFSMAPFTLDYSGGFFILIKKIFKREGL